MREIAYRAGRVIDEKTARTGWDPPAAEVAKELGIDVDTLVEAMEATSPPGYLEDIPSYGDMPVSAGYGSEAPEAHPVELRDALETLGGHMRSIIEGRFLHGKTQGELARELGMSQAHVSRLEKAALSRLRVYLSAEEEILP